MSISTLEIARDLAVSSPTKIVLLVIDGLGGLPNPETGLTELETAHLPNLDRLAAASDVGLTVPLATGVTVGSGPGHLALFGYDPLQFCFRRGATSAMGVGFPMKPGDVAARMNFGTIDDEGLIVDRRAGRISSEEGERLCGLLRKIRIDGVELFIVMEKGHRALVVFRGEGLSDKLTDSDPHHEGVPISPVRPLADEAKHTADLVNKFIREAIETLRGETPANAVLLRGFGGLPEAPSMREIFKLKAAAISAYPTYQGVGRIVGMDVLPAGDELESEVETLENSFGEYDFFYLHVKWTDAAGEDGRFQDKVRVLETVDSIIPRIERLGPDVLAVGGDHSSPSVYREHTWHPVPFMLHSPWCLPARIEGFTERECAKGSLGRFPAERAMLLMMGHAGKLAKFGG
ncbi:MAG: 2,3-bisphosphoglycerate-independent phosphoglycerate mutase [Chloroflexota bacterium]|jgi:2,3-bisphosphoglycerate-independent phosphoglycerate mutase